MLNNNWKNVNVEYGKEFLQIKVPPWCDILKTNPSAALKNPEQQIENALSNPIACSPIEDIITNRQKPPSDITVAISVSDNTRPVPYNSERKDGILLPLLKRLKHSGIKNENVIIVIGTGTHQPTCNEWKNQTFGKFITDNYKIIDHDCASEDLCELGNIDGVLVKINREFLQADIHITTGLVESHFMAGVSGGRKAVCPGLVNLEITYLFHSAEFMDDPNAKDLVLENNPCHDFALKVAKKARVDFTINAVLNGDMELAGIFAGDLEKAHLEATEKVRKDYVIPVTSEYDIILTHGGKVAVNHYQAAKAACVTTPIIKKNGTVILVAHNGDAEAIGKKEYKKVMKVLDQKGPGKFTEFIKSSEWQFTPDQWQVQKWDQFFVKIGDFDNLIYCTTNIGPDELKNLPGKSGYDFVGQDNIEINNMVQNAVCDAVDRAIQKTENPKMAFIQQGPYAVPILKEKS